MKQNKRKDFNTLEIREHYILLQVQAVLLVTLHENEAGYSHSAVLNTLT